MIALPFAQLPDSTFRPPFRLLLNQFNEELKFQLVDKAEATFFIQELAETDRHGRPKLRLQYVQVVQLDFFPRLDGGPGRIKWPHVSINTLEKVTGEVKLDSYARMPS